MQIALIYDPRFHSWESWSSLMCEAYSTQQLAINTPEDQWREWAEGLSAIDVFMNEAIPSPHGFEKWHDWATALMGAVNTNEG